MPRIGRLQLPVSFGAKLQGAFREKGQLCVGIDPHPELLESWGHGDDIAGLEFFSRNLLELCVDQVGIIKPQVAFYERFGAKGLAVLEDLCNTAAETNLVVILDAKRGDIDSTMRAYFDAWLGKDAPFQCDALTVSPFLGFESLMPTLASCLDRGKGLFVLAATSNSGSSQIQKATSSGVSVARSIWDQLDVNNAVTAGPKSTLGSFGAVIGATLNLQAFGLEQVFSGESGLATPILAPGFGAQGAKLSESRSIFGAASDRVVHTVSRSVCDSGKLAVARNIESAKSELLLGLG
jgi:orotidine-5'-phosphate decarboxylase